MSPNSLVDVLVIGAGPAGLMSTYNLAQAGINVRVVDQKLERVLKGQADVIQVRGIEILESIGLASKLVPTAHHTYAYTTYKADSSGHISRVSKFDAHFGIESRFKFTANQGQSFVEGVFRDALAAGEKLSLGLSFKRETGLDYTPRKVVVEQGVFPTRLTVLEGKTEYPVEVQLEDQQGKKETIRAKYVIGCDGAHSWTRAQLGIDMVGDTSDSVWGLIDVFIDSDFPDIRNLTVVENNGRLVKEVFKPYRIDFVGEPWWDGVYVVGQRLASAYEGAHGRAFIVGDACHTHSPHAGQGMNAAMSDGHNLAWKLVHVLKGWADPKILRTRMPHQVILRVADSRPYSTHDLLKCDFRYTLLLFTGDIKLPAQYKRVKAFLEGIGSDRTVFKLFTILLAKKETCQYTDVPKEARSHWDTVFVDDIAYAAVDGGGTTYQSFGIGSEGCVVVVRPDGHVAMVVPFDGADDVRGFFERVKVAEV
ncbi:hypothetical protein FRC06_000538 [Ceratobasidium sp. 370]|nr:hypothetical protein FRC06_000538 [Ceratobasidium sp. 370]